MQQAVSTLKTMIYLKQKDDSSNKEIHSLIKDKSNSALSINNDSYIAELDINKYKTNLSLQSQKSGQLIIMDSENNPSYSSFQVTNLSRDSFESTLNNINNIVVDKLITSTI